MCRSNPASSVVIALARNATWLDDAQVQSIFHRLRHDHDPINRPGESREQMVERVFARAGNQIARDPALRPQRREGLRNRLDSSRAQTGSLGDDTLLAMARLQAGVQTAQLATEGRLTEIAGRRGMSVREARAEFIRLRSEAPSGRQPRATAPELRDLGIIPSDPATRYALAEMASRPPVTPPVRLVDQWLTVTGGEGGGVSHVGVGARSTRLEFRHDDGTISAIRGLNAADQDTLREAAEVGQLSSEVASRLRRENQPVPDERIEATAYAPRCDECGQFVGDRFHDCRARAARVAAVEPVTVNLGGAELSIAPAAAVMQAVETQRGPVVLGQVSYTTQDAVVTGTVSVRPGEDVVTAADRLSQQRIDIDDAEPGALECSACPDADGACPHVAQARAHIRDHLGSVGRLPGQRTERAARTDLLHNSISVSPRTEEQPTAPPAGVLSFVDDPEAFRTVIRQGGADREVPFMAEDALHGYAAGARFGVELEFNGDDSSVRSRVAQRLQDAGLITSASYSGYHTATRSGYNDQGLYSLENDCSVSAGGELVSIESDSPESWDRLRRACEAINGGGGTTHFAGSHTNIGSPNYRPEDGWRLARLFRAHEDDLLRCGRTPNSQRLNTYNAPLRDPGPQWDSEYDWGRAGQRESVVNFTNAFRARGRIEFRFPDASHDPGVIQAQIKLAAAMTNYSRTELPIPDGHQQVGTAQREGWTNQLMTSTSQQWAERTERIRGLIDTLFDRQDDRQQIAMLWAHGRYRRG